MTNAQFETLVAGRQDDFENPAATERDLWRAIRNDTCKMYEVKEIDVNLATNPTYLADNFIMAAGPTLGLGIGDMAGFAICNGNNGTKNRKGRVALGYDPSAYPVIGALGGVNTVTLTEAQLPVITLHARGSNDDTGDPGNLIITSPSNENSGINLPSFGSGQPHTNLQPYIVTLFIQRIA